MKRFEALLLSDTIVSKMVHYSKLHSYRNCSTISWWSNAAKLTTIKCKSTCMLMPRFWRVYRSDQSWNSVSAVKLM